MSHHFSHKHPLHGLCTKWGSSYWNFCFCVRPASSILCHAYRLNAFQLSKNHSYPSTHICSHVCALAQPLQGLSINLIVSSSLHPAYFRLILPCRFFSNGTSPSPCPPCRLSAALHSRDHRVITDLHPCVNFIHPSPIRIPEAMTLPDFVNYFHAEYNMLWYFCQPLPFFVDFRSHLCYNPVKVP